MMQSGEKQAIQPVIMRSGIKAMATTVAGVTLGLVCGLTAMVAVAAVDIFLPVGLCLWSGVTSLAGGSIGLLVGTKKTKGALA